MKMLFKEKIFTWFDSYDIYDEEKNIIYKVKGELSWGHQLRIYDNKSNKVGMIKEKVLALLPRFAMYEDNKKIGEIRKELTLFRPRFNLTCNDWKVKGDIFEWEYKVVDSNNNIIMTANKKLLNLTDTYEIDVVDEKNALYALMIVIAIDAIKCSRDQDNNK